MNYLMISGFRKSLFLHAITCTLTDYYLHTIHSPTDAHLLKFWLQFILKLDGSYMFRFTTIIRELEIEPG